MTSRRRSRVTGRRQAVALRWIITSTFLAAAIGVVVPGSVGDWASTAAVASVMVTPLLRVLWLSGRWWHEGDLRFALLGIALLAVIGTGAALAALT